MCMTILLRVAHKMREVLHEKSAQLPAGKSKTVVHPVSTGEWPTPWTQSLVITLPKKGNLQQCQNYRTISLISYPSKAMLKIILNRLKPQAEKINVEEQAGFRAEGAPQSGSSTYEFSVRNILSTSKTSPCLHRLQEGLRQGLACSFVGNHEVHQHQPAILYRSMHILFLDVCL